MGESKCCCLQGSVGDVLQESKAISRIFVGFLFYAIGIVALQPVTVMFSGRMGTIQLDAVALSNSLINITGNIVIVGLASACDTVFSQTFGGENFKLLGLQLQRAIVIHTLALCVCLAIHLNMEGILLLMGQEPEISRLAGRYMLINIPGVALVFASETMRRFAFSQGITTPFGVIGICTLVLHIFFQHLYVNVLDLGIDGSVLGNVTSRFVQASLTIGLIIYKGLMKRSWTGWDLRLFEEWGEYTKLAVFSMLLIAMDWVTFEVTLILAGIVGNTELGAQGVLFSCVSISIVIPISLSSAACIRLAQLLGAGEGDAAKFSGRISYIITGVVGIIAALVVWLLRNKVPRIFTDIKDVYEMAADVMPYLALYIFAAHLNTVLKGILRSAALQVMATGVAFIGLGIFAMPIGISLLLLTPMSLKGLWLGLAIGFTLNSTMYFIYIAYMDWPKLAEEAMHRAQKKTGTPNNNTTWKENTPILLMSKRQGSVEDDGDQTRTVPSKIILQKLLVILFFFLILLAGIFCRIGIPIPYRLGNNGTLLIYNETDLFKGINNTIG